MRITVPALPAEDSAEFPSEPCPVCHDTGVMRWQQPTSGPASQFVLREMEHPCVNGCGEVWTLPAAERDQAVDAPTEPTELPATRETYPEGRLIGHADDVPEAYVDFVRRFVHDRGLRWGNER
jgi:hypothetical protein